VPIRLDPRATGTLAVSLSLATGSALGLFLGAAPAGALNPPPSFSFTFTASGPVDGSTATFTGSGQADPAGHELAASVVVPPSVTSRLPGGPGGATTVDVVLAGVTLYVSWPGLGSVTGGKPWASVALPSADASAIANRIARAASAVADVDGFVAGARRQHAAVSSLGTGVVDGVAVTGWSISAPPRHRVLLPAVRPGDRPAGLRTVPAAGAGSGGLLELELWADAGGQLVRASGHDVGAKTTVASAQVDLSGYGAPVTITVPPAAEVAAVPAGLAGGLLDQWLPAALPRPHHRAGRS